MRKITSCALMLLAASLMLWGCGEKEEEGAPGARGEFEIDPQKEIARVNGRVITAGILQRQLELMLRQYAGQVPPAQLQQLRPMLRQQALSFIINQQLLLEAAEMAGMTPTDEEIEQEIDRVIEQFPSREDFEDQLASVGATMEDVRRDITRNLQLNMLLEEKAPTEEVTEEEIEEFYNENLDSFEEPEQVEASHILISYQGASRSEEERTKEEARALAEEVIEQAQEEGADFAALAVEYSDGPTGPSGGELGFFGRDQMAAPFEEAAFALETGEISGVVETEFGFHVIRVTDRKEERVAPLEEVKEKISTFLEARKKQEEVQVYIGELREEADIEYAPGFEPRVPMQPRPPAAGEGVSAPPAGEPQGAQPTGSPLPPPPEAGPAVSPGE